MSLALLLKRGFRSAGNGSVSFSLIVAEGVRASRDKEECRQTMGD